MYGDEAMAIFGGLVETLVDLADLACGVGAFVEESRVWVEFGHERLQKEADGAVVVE